MVYDGFRPEDLMEACVELTVWDHHKLTNQFLGGLRIGFGTGICYIFNSLWAKCFLETVEVNLLLCFFLMKTDILFLFSVMKWMSEGMSGCLPRALDMKINRMLCLSTQNLCIVCVVGEGGQESLHYFSFLKKHLWPFVAKSVLWIIISMLWTNTDGALVTVLSALFALLFHLILTTIRWIVTVSPRGTDVPRNEATELISSRAKIQN